jgi:dihydroorotate dehydrogenase
MIYKHLIKPFFFAIDPESAHYLAMDSFALIHKLPFGEKVIRLLFKPENKKSFQYLGLTFPNPVGLAAGFDKNAKYIRELTSLGFGFIEIGTVTPKPQQGNDKPRLFRLPKDEALINRMGFNNDGVDEVVKRLKKIKKSEVIIGGNIGKNKDTPNEKAVDDYIICLEKLHPYVDYFVVNVSSPNTPGLRALQDKEPLTNILNQLQSLNLSFTNPKPILLKIAPDLNLEQLNDVIDIVQITGIAGLIANNTTISRDGLQTDEKELENIGNGGLSGKPLVEKSSEILQYIKKKSPNTFVISVGGIHNTEIAKSRMDSGAELIQIYTSFIYNGPSFVKRLVERLS